MCGIGVIVWQQEKPTNTSDDGSQRGSQHIIREMMDKVAHRGPDGEGFFSEGNVALGHRRLSIIDLTDAGAQPMHYRERLTITYNGEIYNYIEVREELQTLGYVFTSASDTEVILAAYHEWGAACVSRFNGMWSFVIYDRSTATLFCSRDRFGVKPFNYTTCGDTFAIASEIKQFKALEGFEPRMNEEAAYMYLRYGLLNHNEQTFFEGVRVLPAGHNLFYDLTDHTFRIEQWFDVANTPPNTKIRKAEAAEQFRTLFQDSVALRLRSDVKVGSCLSGGLDSSSIVSGVREQLGAGQDIYTVSSCFEQHTDIDEQYYIDIVNAEKAATPVKVYPDMDDLETLGLWESIIYHQDQPIPSGSHFSEYKVFQTARANDLVVMLDGQGADEYLCGYGEFWYADMYEKLIHGQWWGLNREIRAKSKYIGTHPRRLLLIFLLSVAQTWFPDSEYIKRKVGVVHYHWINKAWSEKYGATAAALRFDTMQHITDVRTLSIAQLKHTSIPYQLHSEDRNSMMNSVESRIPFLDYRLVQFGLSLPTPLKSRNGISKVVLREAMQGILPDIIATRYSKLGFPAPDEAWMRENPALIRTKLTDALGRLEGIVTPAIVEDFDAFIAHKNSFTDDFFRVISLSIWMQVFNVKISEK